MLVKHINLPADLGWAHLEKDENGEMEDHLSLWR